eukprot:jgi/Botrbrau1/738/Bobra.160_2s0061.1
MHRRHCGGWRRYLRGSAMGEGEGFPGDREGRSLGAPRYFSDWVPRDAAVAPTWRTSAGRADAGRAGTAQLSRRMGDLNKAASGERRQRREMTGRSMRSLQQVMNETSAELSRRGCKSGRVVRAARKASILHLQLPGARAPQGRERSLQNLVLEVAPDKNQGCRIRSTS